MAIGKVYHGHVEDYVRAPLQLFWEQAAHENTVFAMSANFFAVSQTNPSSRKFRKNWKLFIVFNRM